jgi:signal transduction histidine kinase
MTRPWLTGGLFALGALTLLGVLGWSSGMLLELESAQARSRADAEREERYRLALWRLDSRLGPIVAQESARPYFQYTAWYPANRAYAEMFDQCDEAEIQVPSPLHLAMTPFVRLHFQRSNRGKLSSPQLAETVPPPPPPAKGKLIDGKGRNFRPAPALAEVEARARLTALAEASDWVAIGRAIPPLAPVSPPIAPVPQQLAARQTEAAIPASDAGNAIGNPPTAVPGPPQISARPDGSLSMRRTQRSGPSNQAPQYAQGQNPQQQGRQVFDPKAFAEEESQKQSLMNDAEYGNRSAAAVRNAVILKGQWNSATPAPSVRESPLTPLWHRGELLLVRRVEAGGQEWIQGCVFDWPALRDDLLEAIADLCPDAELVGVDNSRNEADPSDRRRLATLPLRLEPAPEAEAAVVGWSPLRLVLGIAWIGAVLALAAVITLFVGAVSLGERRAAFVSAVTHELRTPLTTFAMYSEMLARGFVRDPERQRQYHETLLAESSRLGHLIENVLAYARLERGRTASPASRPFGPLFEASVERIRPRLEAAGFELETELSAEAATGPVAVDPLALDQILFNLADNASKYARQALDRRLTLSASLEPRRPGWLTAVKRVLGFPRGNTRLNSSEASSSDGKAGTGGGSLVIRFRDRGPGVPPADRDRIFRPFIKSARDAAHSAPGVGLGLALSRRLARDVGGDLTLAPCPDDGPGACFQITLPAR